MMERLKVTPNNALERQIRGGRTVLAMDCVLAGAEAAPWWELNRIVRQH